MTIRTFNNGIWWILRPDGCWTPDYSVPGTKEKVEKQVDEAYDAHWPLDRQKL